MTSIMTKYYGKDVEWLELSYFAGGNMYVIILTEIFLFCLSKNKLVQQKAVKKKF